MATMTQEVKERLKSAPKRECLVCHSKKSYTNPMAKCFVCEKDFCFDHIIGGCLAKKGEPVKDICKECFGKRQYKLI